MKKLKDSNQDEQGRGKWLEAANSKIVKRQGGQRVLERPLQSTVALEKKATTVNMKKMCGQTEKR